MAAEINLGRQESGGDVDMSVLVYGEALAGGAGYSCIGSWQSARFQITSTKIRWLAVTSASKIWDAREYPLNCGAADDCVVRQS
jgi:hypothetical protein